MVFKKWLFFLLSSFLKILKMFNKSFGTPFGGGTGGFGTTSTFGQSKF